MGKTSEFSEVGDYWPQEHSMEIQGQLDIYTSRKFHDLMDNRMLVSHYKYGDTREAYPEKLKAVENINIRVQRYLETGNVEWLVDAANFCMIEFMHPSLINAYFKATDSQDSPGLQYNNGELKHGRHSEA